MWSGLGGNASTAYRHEDGESNRSFGSVPNEVVMNPRAIFRSVSSSLNAPAIAMSSVKMYQSRQSAASVGFLDVDSATPIS
jgi:hypothetical protein